MSGRNRSVIAFARKGGSYDQLPSALVDMSLDPGGWALVAVLLLLVASASGSVQGLAGRNQGAEVLQQSASDGISTCQQTAGQFFSTSEVRLTDFWAFEATALSAGDIHAFRRWYSLSKFKEVSPKVGGAWFRKGPFHQGVDIGPEGRMNFVRLPTDGDDHTMLEVSVNGDSRRGNYVEYGGYRAMRLGVPYEINVTVSVEGEQWWKDIPWAVVLQGHAIPDAPKLGEKYNPPFALVVIRGRWQIHVRADERSVLPVDRSYQRFDQIDLGPVKEGRSIDVRVRVVWSYDEKVGVLAIWRDGVRYHSEVGRRNFYNTKSPNGDAMGPYVTFGAYMSRQDLGKQMATVSISRLRIAGGSWQGIADCGNGDGGAAVPNSSEDAKLWQ